MNKFYKAEKDLCKIINSEIWIKLKKHFWMLNFTQKVKGMTIYKISCEKNEYVFATSKQKGTQNIYILDDQLKKKALDDHIKYIRWTGDYESLFLESFRYLLIDYGFSFSYLEFKNAVDENNKFFYYGPVYCGSLYNDDSCINFILLVQRGEWDVYLTEKFTKKQSEIRNGKYLSDGFKALKTFYSLEKKTISNSDYISAIAFYIQKEIVTYNEVYGINVEKQKPYKTDANK